MKFSRLSCLFINGVWTSSLIVARRSCSAWEDCVGTGLQFYRWHPARHLPQSHGLGGTQLLPRPQEPYRVWHGDSPKMLAALHSHGLFPMYRLFRLCGYAKVCRTGSISGYARVCRSRSILQSAAEIAGHAQLCQLGWTI